MNRFRSMSKEGVKRIIVLNQSGCKEGAKRTCDHSGGRPAIEDLRSKSKRVQEGKVNAESPVGLAAESSSSVPRGEGEQLSLPQFLKSTDLENTRHEDLVFDLNLKALSEGVADQPLLAEGSETGACNGQTIGDQEVQVEDEAESEVNATMVLGRQVGVLV
ncbi:hypothetical protein L1987_36246 [Smallanthus sonchifolius]|uniref:Uncharacterized protein n=1 Tax=Smallanthus sonchifolius TaxID=185202 RepID=A0ACB9HDP5_9ASTR|nr:hypothetical protein L1987_36246 [Smallanthus sonchifolius]